MLYAVIMAGGRGKRFWPRSRIKRPKQLLNISDENASMIKLTLSRLKPLVPLENIQIVTNYKQLDSIKKELSELSDDQFIPEPMMKNTAACIGLSAVLLKAKDPDAIMLALPADHIIKDQEEFLSTVRFAQEFVKDKKALMTFGIKPTYPSTGYGYIEVLKDINILQECKDNTESDKIHIKDIYRIKRFREKPSRNKAEKFVNSDNYYWNSGIFLWRVDTILESFKKFMPHLYKYLLKIENILRNKDFYEKLVEIYSEIPEESIDCGIMERAALKRKKRGVPQAYTIIASFSWNDVGSWRSLEDILEKDKMGNVKIGETAILNTKNCIIVSDSSNSDHLVGAIDIKDLIIVHTKDATLVCRKESAQKIKNLVKIIEDKGLEKYL